VSRHPELDVSTSVQTSIGESAGVRLSDGPDGLDPGFPGPAEVGVHPESAARRIVAAFGGAILDMHAAAIGLARQIARRALDGPL
jgi:hypothetical protein